MGAITPKRNRARDPLREKESETGLTRLGSVVQHRSGESLCQRALKGSGGLGSSLGTWIALSLASRC